MTLTVTPCRDQTEWDALVDEAGGHPLQLWGWGELKSRYEWSADRLVVRDGDRTIGSAQVLLRTLPRPFRSLAYIPRGPQAAEEDRGPVLAALTEYVRTTHRPIALSIEPDWEQPGAPLEKGADENQIAVLQERAPVGWLAEVEAAGFRRSTNTGLIPRTLIVDVRADDETLMKGLTSSTRQNVRKSFRAEGVRFGEVTTDSDLDAVLAINRATAERADFAVHDDAYHRGIRDLLGDRSRLLAAWEGEELVAFIWLVVSGTTAFELYGGVNPRGMKLRLNYGLKFHAMTQMREAGVSRYDFNGLLNDGISDFKRQFAGHEDLLLGTWDAPLSPLYSTFERALPVVRRGLKRGVPAVRGVLRDPRGAVEAAVRAARSGKPQSTTA
ncbi:peptidoglycan bridge formation glycyltransferase FemA/FemB family protein [Allobranchiibius sp. GilTou38]|uniref:lipid II:glycine glycyltransferase FemX n=1 Tax=Allobranchiibius sp. GilTou38 TaxID=2815210 RepID=UPI001AA11276|nr:peptidoglycan bridge formation glycyltransferase FemA/FemB family protein [Allobranchiibius sp. GilTou38]MBO1768132.1 peptidoglycan bridge formation glycyltransferase FemA/FemB family protein [Allobranchiibius sp. GilTou38]